MPMNEVTAVVLAGGRGTRISSLYPDVPKPLIPVAGKPFLFWLTAWLVKQGIDDIIFSTGHRASQVEQWLDSLSSSSGIQITTKSEDRPLGTGGAVRNCLESCRNVVLIVNGDTLFLVDLRSAAALLDRTSLDGVMLAVHTDDASRYGALAVDDGVLTGFFEKSTRAPGLVYGGALLLKRAVMETVPEGVPLSLELDLLQGFLRKGVRIGVIEANGPFIDIGTPETVSTAADFVRRHQAHLAIDWAKNA